MITVVGKGPSLKGECLGSLIDSCGAVVRTAGGKLNDDCGYRTDYIVVTTLAVPELKESDLTGVKEVWVYRTKNRWGISNYIEYIQGFYDGPIRFLDTKEWVDAYAKEARPMYSPKVNYPSKGTIAVLEAIRYLPYMHINVLGFDFITGKTKVDWVKHDFPLEKRMIYDYAKLMNKKVRII